MPAALLRLPLVIVLALASAACGVRDDQGGADVLQGLTGPPQWRLVREALPDDGMGLTLRVRSPVRVRLRHRGSQQLEQDTGWRELAAGQTLQVQWGQREPGEGEAKDRPGREDEAAGRTDRHVRRMHLHFSDQSVTYLRFTNWSRPGKGVVQAVSALPSGRYEDLPMPGTIELLTLAFSDLAEGAVTLRRREQGSVLRPPASMGPEDRILTWSLFLDIEPLAD